MAKENISRTSTKNEIFDAYEALLKKVADSENMKPQEIKEKAEKEILVKKVAEMTPETIVRGIADLKLRVAAAFDQVEDTLVSEQKRLSEVRQAITIQKQLLDELYQVKATADSLAAMLLAHKEKKIQLEAEAGELKASLDRKREEFDEEMDAKRAEWEREKAKMVTDLKEERERIKKERQREEEEYLYMLNVNRRKEQDDYNEARRKAEAEFTTRIAAAEKDLKQRGEAITAREQEYASLSARVARFDEDLAKAVKDAEKSASDKLKTQYGFEKELLLAEHEGQVKLKDQTILTLENRIKEQDGYVKQLTQKTEQADRSVKDIAIKAIESSAKVQLFEAPQVKKSE